MDANKFLRAMEGKIVQTQDGAFVKLSDLKKVMEEMAEDRTAPRPKPRNFQQAKLMAQMDESLMGQFGKRPLTVDTPTAIEGVKS